VKASNLTVPASLITSNEAFERIMEVHFRIAGCGGQYNKNFYMRRIKISGKGPIIFKANRQQQNG